MTTIRLFCAAGMSTSLLVKRMEDAAAAEGMDVDIQAFSVNDFGTHFEEAQVILLGPQVGYMKKQLTDQAAAKGIPCEVIPMADYGMVNGKNVLAFAMKLLG